MSLTLESVNGPTLSTANKLLKICDDECIGCFVGEKLTLPQLETQCGIEVIDVTVIAMPSADDDDYDKELYDNFDTQALVRLNIDCSTYSLETPKPKSKKLRIDISNLFGSYKDFLTIVKQEVSDKPPLNGKKQVDVVIVFEAYEIVTSKDQILSSPFYTEFWDQVMNGVVVEGVCYSNTLVPSLLCNALRTSIIDLAAKTSVDYHPNSNDIVRDLVHPALYPYVEGVSKFKTSISKNDIIQFESGTFDFWGREYEDSKFQWLPTPFQISDTGRCVIKEYINNLDREKFIGLYNNLERLFELFLPYFEEVWSYAKAMHFWNTQAEENLDDYDPAIVFKKSPVSFKGQELQVITKIVEYKLKPVQSYEGVWHAEGMSHENIVMTGIYFIDRDSDLHGGDLRFKRSFQMEERTKVYFSIPQSRAFIVNEFANEGVMPLGHFPTDEGYALVFPNCHIHKIAKLVNESTMKEASRRIVVFFVVNPERRIISTADVAPQQNVIPLDQAKKFRLELMAERKYTKEKLNLRDIELCEH